MVSARLNSTTWMREWSPYSELLQSLFRSFRFTQLGNCWGPIAWAAVFLSGAREASGTDWPTFRHDARRSGVTAEVVPATRLTLAWQHEASRPPQPAWDGPARWDAYVKRRILSNMRDYGAAYHVIVVGDAVYYASSTDDAVHRLDAATGERVWSFTTGGPVRVVPTWSQGRLYFGSDDGFAYAIEATSGELAWKFCPAPHARRVLHNGRLISPWPCRTGVAVEDGTAYCAAGLFPWQASFVCAVDAKTGRPEGQGRYVKQHEKLGLEGALLLSANRLIGTQGRAAPYLFDRHSGEGLGQLGTVGGSFALVAPNNRLYAGPGAKEGTISETDQQQEASVVKCGGLAMAVGSDIAYVVERGVVAALRLSDSHWIWRQKADYSYAITLAGDAVFVGGDDKVAAFNASDGAPLWWHDVEGRAHGIVVAQGGVFVSTDEGHIYCFRAAETVDRERSAFPPPAAVAETALPDEPQLAEVPEYIIEGPYLEFIGIGTARLRWTTEFPSPTTVRYGLNACDLVVHDPEPKTRHEAQLEGLRPRRVYNYEIVTVQSDEQLVAPPLECDTHFNYHTPYITPGALSRLVGKARNEVFEKAAARVVADPLPKRGIALVLHAGSGLLAVEIAERTGLNVIGIETDERQVAKTREALQKSGHYGERISILHVESMADLPLPDHCANLIVADATITSGHCDTPVAEVQRLLHPHGRALMGQPAAIVTEETRRQMTRWLGKAARDVSMHDDQRGLWAQLDGAPLKGAGEWSHQYGKADNATFAGETLRGARTTDDFGVQWFGRPGPRYQSDRQNRKPAPLSTGGRLYLQGLDRVIALDAYNGMVLWNLEIPGAARFNMRHDSANWCADEHHVFLAVRDRCWQIDAASGEVDAMRQVAAGPRDDAQYDWGYIGRHGPVLVGSAVLADSAYREFWGGQYWYSYTGGPLAAKICSAALFALDPHTGEEKWRYQNGLVINTSITMAEGKVFFVESRHPALQKLDTGRVEDSRLWEDRFLVALDAGDGSVVWQHPLDTDNGETMFSMAHGGGQLVTVSSAAAQYYIVVFDAERGRQQWATHMPWPGDSKGLHSSRPVIVGDRLYIRPGAFELQTGAPIDITWPGGTCGTYCAAQDVLLFRAGNMSLWSPSTAALTGWERLRPDCWMSAIPAAGMVLSPEGSGGCSCGGWLQTSIAFLPRRGDDR